MNLTFLIMLTMSFILSMLLLNQIKKYYILCFLSFNIVLNDRTSNKS